MTKAHRRELQRRILETMAGMRGSGWVTASDIVDRLNPADGRTDRDGRRVAGTLRRLRREGLVEIDLDPGVLLEYRITDAGVAWMYQAQRDTPRLTDPPPRSWPRARVAHRHRGGRP